MYESMFLEQYRTFADVARFVEVEKQSQKHPLFGAIDVFESSYSPNRSFFYGKLLGALRLFHNASLVKKEALLKEDIMHNEAVCKEYALLHMICYTLFRHGADFHPLMPNELRYRYQAPTKEVQDKAEAYRNSESFKEQQKLEYEAQFSKIGLVLANEKVRGLFEEALAKKEVGLLGNAHRKFMSFSMTLLTDQERAYHASSKEENLELSVGTASYPPLATKFKEYELEPPMGTAAHPSFSVGSKSVTASGEHDRSSQLAKQPQREKRQYINIPPQYNERTPARQSESQKETQPKREDSILSSDFWPSKEMPPLSVAPRCVPSLADNERKLSQREGKFPASQFKQPKDMSSTSSSSNAPREVVEAKPYPSLPIEPSSDLLPGFYKRQRSQEEDSFLSNAFWHPSQSEDTFCPNAFLQSIKREDGFFSIYYQEIKRHVSNEQFEQCTTGSSFD